MGFASDMFSRLRSNNALLANKRVRYRKVIHAYSDSKQGASLYENERKPGKETWMDIKKKIKADIKRKRQNEIYLFLLLMVITLLVGLIFWWILFL